MLEQNISWKVLKTFTQECYNDDLRVDLEVFMAKSNSLSGFLYGGVGGVL